MNYIGVMACCFRSGVIGYRGKVPWNYPEELEFYRKIVKDQKHLIMGYLTYFSMPESALKDRVSIVFSKVHQQTKKNCPAQFVSSWEQFDELKLESGCMIGGGQIAELFIEKNALHSFYLTRIYKEYQGDAFFPWWNLLKNWSSLPILHTPNYRTDLFTNLSP